jgi:hypothetical protein
MYSVGSIDPDGMLNGAMTKLRKAHASSITVTMKRTMLNRLSPGAS